MTDRWSPKVEALRRLIAPNSGATDAERDTAETKLKSILQIQYGETEGYCRFAYFEKGIEDDPGAFDAAFAETFTTHDFLEMKRAGISTDGEWTGKNMQEATEMMVADYARRSGRLRKRRIES